jgi:DNA-binding NarL/FixJ family response regulator
MSKKDILPNFEKCEENTLTAREHDVLILLCDGLRVKEIGHRLGISPKTVEYHRANISRRWAVKSTAMLVRKAIRLRIIQA